MPDRALNPQVPQEDLTHRKHIVIGTAGHVDHGKTTLVKALTGVDTDRLPEEKLREMTIDLGFARIELPSGRTASIVDVPGHERFVGNMLAGATGIDLVLFVVAADEGVMPQTTEHLDILTLLGLETGIVVLTKADLVDAEWLDAVSDELAETAAGTFLAHAPLVAVSSRTGQGIDDLRRLVDQVIDTLPGRAASGPARIPVDRVFTVAGFGTVVTGTMVSGSVAVGDYLELLPSNRQVRVRSLQVHGDTRGRAFAGERVAVNLAGLERADVQRGEVLAAPGLFVPGQRFDGLFRYTDRVQRELKTRTRVHLHVGTAEVVGRLLLLEADSAETGSETLVQFHSESPLVVGPKDRFIVRSYSPRRTIGGGVVIDAAPPFRRSRPKGARAAALTTALRLALRGTPQELVCNVLDRAAGPLESVEVGTRAQTEYGLPAEEVQRVLTGLVAGGEAVATGEEPLYISARVLAAAAASSVEWLAGYHRRFPLRAGPPRDELRAATASDVPPRRYPALFGEIARQGHIAVDGDRVRLPGFQVRPDAVHHALALHIESAYAAAGASPPEAAAVLATAAAALIGSTGGRRGAAGAAATTSLFDQVFEYLVARGVLVRVTEGQYFHREAMTTVTGLLARYLQQQGPVSVSDFRQLIGTTRKYAVPLLEYFDTAGVTRRQGDMRIAGSSLAEASAQPREKLCPPGNEERTS